MEMRDLYWVVIFARCDESLTCVCYDKKTMLCTCAVSNAPGLEIFPGLNLQTKVLSLLSIRSTLYKSSSFRGKNMYFRNLLCRISALT